MAEVTCMEDLLAAQRKEKKDLEAKTQKMKHGVSKGDKKRKREVNIEIAQLLESLNIKHEKEMKEFESNNPATETTNHCLNDVTQVSAEAHVTETVPKLTKNQKRRNKKAMLNKERSIAIAAQELENLNGLRHLESESIKKKLSERNLVIHEIPSDGNCLYKAVEHQLSSLNLKTISMQSLRELTSQYMVSHMEDYIPFLTDSETGDVFTEAQYVKYCEDIAKTPAWGGHIEIQVLSHICDVPIEVIQSDGPSVFAGNENCNPKLILSYHRHVFGLGEHYNSVVRAAE